MLESKLHRMYDLKNDDVKDNSVLRQKAELFGYVYNNMLTERVIALFCGIVGTVSGISAIAHAQQDERMMCGVYALGAIACVGAGISYSVSAHNKRKILHNIGREMEEIRENPEYIKSGKV